MCMDGIPAVAVIDPDYVKSATSQRTSSDSVVVWPPRIDGLFTLSIIHGFFDLSDADLAIRMVLLDVLPIGSVPHDRPLVHIWQYTSTGYPVGIYVGVASGT